MDNFVHFIFRQRFIVILIASIVIIAGIISWKQLPIDAFPDVTNVQVMILTEASGFAPSEVERLITYPVEIEMNGLPNVRHIRSLSRFGLSQVVIVFEDWVDIYFARQLVFERLQTAKEKLPEGIVPEMGPISTGLGEIYQYTLSGNEKHGLMDLRTVQDFIIRPQLRLISGVADVNSFGGFSKQYQVIVNPDKLLQYDLTLGQVSNALSKNNANVTANYIVKGSEQIVVRGIGLIKTIEDIENVTVDEHEGTPIYVRNMADVVIGHETRWGAVTRDNKGEIVCGMVIMLRGSNSKNVVDAVKSAIRKIRERLPEGIIISPFYDRTDLIKLCIKTVTKAMIEGGILVIIILFLLLGDVRTAVVVCFSLPLSALICFISMRVTGLTANLMSLGGLVVAVGMIVDASIVVAENIFRHLSDNPGIDKKGRISICINATTEVMRPVMFAILITIITKFPLFALQAVEGKMFKPLALTLIFAMTGSLIISLTVVPVVGSFFIKGIRKERKNVILGAIEKAYLPVLNSAVKHKKITIAIALSVFCVSVFLMRFIGTEFLPYMDEGSIALNVVKFPTASLEESVRVGNMLEKMILEYPEVSAVVTKTGRAEIAEDPMGPEQSDIFIMLKPKKFWKLKSKMELIESMNEKLGKVPGLRLNFSQPITLRVNELISGVRSDLAVKIFGYDLDLLGRKAEKIEHIIAEMNGAKDVKVEQISGFTQLDIEIDRESIARYGINVSDVNEIIETAIGGKVVSTIFEEDKRFGLTVRFPESRRNDEKSIGDMLVTTTEGQKIPMRQIAEIKFIEVPNQISRENGKRRIVVECNVRGRDIGGFVAEAREKIRNVEQSLPTGYYIEWGGQFENQERAMRTLSVVTPIVISLIFIMLYATFGAVKPAVLVIMNLPFAVVGGIIGALIFKITLSVSAMVGFITLLGIAVANGVVLVSFFIQLGKRGASKAEAVITGCKLRLRPLLLTSLCAVFGLIPMLFASGPGAEIQKPIAIIVLGGLVSSSFLTLIVIPAVYVWFEKEKV